MEIMGLERGHVTPFGVLNDKERKVTVVFDQTLQDKTLGIHPMENTASVFVAFDEVKKLIEAHGNPIVICDLDEA
jgi:Ala-tRNA(Pro) deacylase